MAGDPWEEYRKVLRRAAQGQLEETDFKVWVGNASERGGLLVRARHEGGRTKQTMPDILVEGDGRPLLLMAEAGAGKSTMVLQLLLERIDEQRPPVLVQLGSWNGTGALLQFAPGVSDRLLESIGEGGHLIVLDGVDEIRAEDLDGPCEAIVEACRTYSHNQFVVTGRTGEIPRWFPAQFRTAEVLPLDPSEVEAHLRSLLDSAAGVLSEDVQGRLLDLSRNPLILAMTMRVLAEDLYPDADDEGDAISFRSVSSLYQHFLRRIEERDEVKRKTTAPGPGTEDRRAVLRRLGWKMLYHNSVLEERDVLVDWLTEADDLEESPSGPHLRGDFSLVAGKPPLKQISLGGKGVRHGFLHATFRDVYAGEYLLRGGESGKRSYSTADVVLPRGSVLWPAVVHMAGLARSPSAIADEVIQAAVEFRRQELFVLASFCIAARWDSTHQSVDNLCLRLLDAFKNWGEAFDFSLIRAANGLQPRTSSFFPKRLQDDMAYFLGKYSPRVPIALPIRRVSLLKGLIVAGSADEARNAVHTLLQRFDRFDPEGVDAVLDALVIGTRSTVAEVREECLAALQAISRIDQRSALMTRDTFLEFSGPDALPMERVYALQGLAKCGRREDFERIEAALFDRHNPYRDSASWALQRFVHTIGLGSDLRDRALNTYARALETETRDKEGFYAVGNIVYSIGVLGGARLRPQIEEIVATSDSHYVLEDAVNCLGLLADPRSVPIVAPLVRHSDPAVRMKAGEALGRIGGVEAERLLGEALAEEENDVVRESLNTALSTIVDASADAARTAPSALDWLSVQRCLARAGTRNANSMRITEVGDNDFAQLRLAVLEAVGDVDPDGELHPRGDGDRREVVMSNTTFYRLIDEVKTHVE